MKRILSLFLFLAAPGFAVAQTKDQWLHADAAMGQYEGRYEASAGHFINYGCSDKGATVMIGIKGMHIAPGLAKLAVDDQTVFEGSILYASQPDNTYLSFETGPTGHQWQTDQLNKAITAIASGTMLTLTSPNGERFAIPLSGSADIRKCLWNA